MSTLHDTDSTVNVATETEAPTPDATADATAPEPETRSPVPRAEEQRKLDDYAATEAEVVELAVATLDPKDMTEEVRQTRPGGPQAGQEAARRPSRPGPSARTTSTRSAPIWRPSSR